MPDEVYRAGRGVDDAVQQPGRWQTPIIAAEPEREADTRRDLMLTAIPQDAVGAYLSYNSGYDFSTLPQRFILKDRHAEIAASLASQMGFLIELSHRLGVDAELTRKEFLERGLREAVSYDDALADRLEEVFETTGSRGDFMLGHTVSMPLDLVGIADLLVPELQRRGRYPTE